MQPELAKARIRSQLGLVDLKSRAHPLSHPWYFPSRSPLPRRARTVPQLAHADIVVSVNAGLRVRGCGQFLGGAIHASQTDPYQEDLPPRPRRIGVPVGALGLLHLSDWLRQ